MFQLLKFEENSSGVEVIIQYDKPSKPDETVKISQHCLDKEKACIYVNNAMKRYGYEWLKKYIHHKKILSESSVSYKENLGKLSALDKCMKLLGRASVMQIKELAQEILNHYEDLKMILPSTNNNSFNNSAWNLQTLQYWAYEVIKHRHSN